MIKLIDSYSCNNKLRSVSPLWKSGFAAVLFVLAYVCHPLIQLLIVGWLSVWTVGIARIPVRIYFRLLGTSYLFYAFSLPAIIIEWTPTNAWSGISDRTVLVSLLNWTAYVSLNGMQTALSLFLRVAACIGCLFFIILTVPVFELFQVMKKLRMPALVLEIMLIMYRFLFLLEDTAQEMYTAQKARGGHSGFNSRIRDTAILLVRLFSKTMQRYKDLANGLTARGFTEDIAMAPLPAFTVPSGFRRMGITGVLVLLILELWLRWGERL
ncbi:MAG: cobalt transporter permease [Paenibacillus sp.]|jgi:cobalt/nickel transport system permease protein|nr:cobalt transporter permease [Paenibacillus sp.]